MLLLSCPVLVLLLLLLNAGPVAGDGFLDNINSESVSSLLSSESLDNAKKAISAAAPDVKDAVQQFADSAGAKGQDAKEALESWAQSPGGAAASPEIAQALKDAVDGKDGSSWKDWLKGTMSGMGYGSPASSPEGAPEAAMAPASPEPPHASDQEILAAAPRSA
ncbi:unnamed protein product [Linum trigynum]